MFFRIFFRSRQTLRINISLLEIWRQIFNNLKFQYKITKFETWILLRNLSLLFLADILLIDDEPLWEPIEWSMVQVWIFFVFFFAWIAEILIGARFGGYVGRDKRVWYAWYNTFWLLEIWYLFSFGAAFLFVSTPFYYELTYHIAFIVSWWDWFNREFFFRFSFLLVIGYFISFTVLLRNRWLDWYKSFICLLAVQFILFYILFTQFFILYWGYFTDPMWFQKSRFHALVDISHEPLKWGWGPVPRDHISYHHVTASFWFKNDGPFAASFLLLNFFFFLLFLFINFFWLSLLRKIWALKEVPITYLTYVVSTLYHLLFVYLLIFFFVYFGLILAYWRYPIELFWVPSHQSWWDHFFDLVLSYIF